MDGLTAERIESIIDAGAAALLAASVAYVSQTLTTGQTGTTAIAAASCFALSFAGLRNIAPTATRKSVDTVETPVTSLLAEADRSLLEERENNELVLDDILTALGSESRVVQLFDADAMSSPQALKTRIDRHLASQRAIGHVDDSQALYDALSDLRRSLN